MSVKSSGSHEGPAPSNGEVIRSGLLKKMKTARKKFFVLRAETPDALARLEYYDSEKKYKSGAPPKRCIALKTCFDINKRQDTKHKHVIALYTKDDCFCMVLDNEEELRVWLKDLLTLQHGEEIPEGEVPKPKFEYVWEVKLCARGLGTGRTGIYRFCLTDKTITLVKIDEAIPTIIEISLASVRSCGNIKDFFFLEVGRSSNLGAGEIWFEADDTTIASNLQNTVSHRFKLIREKAKLANNTDTSDIQPKGRTRSSSATESTKSNNKKFSTLTSIGSSVFPQDGATPETNVTSTVTTTTTSTTGFRERCDSMPTRPRTSSECNHSGPGWGKPYLLPYRMNHFRDPSHSPPTGSPISPPSDSTGSSYSLPDEHDGIHEMEPQRMYSALTPDQIIAEEECPDSPRANPPGGNYMSMNLGGISENNYTEMNMAHATNPTYTSNSASMSSVTSGTPSTDMRFADYPLDKVCSYVSTDDDDTRPYRAYSIGSKPPEAKAQQAGTPENARVRAFSVGSKTKKYFNRVLPHHSHTSGVKSSSAPILAPNSRMGSSHGSINNPMDDLMEMDFSSSGTSRSRTSTNASGSSDARSSSNQKNSSGPSRWFGIFEHFTGGSHDKKTPEGYVEMRPGVRTTSGSSDVSPYVDMTQGQRSSAYMDMTEANIPLVGHAYSPYMDMSGNNALNAIPQVGNGHSPYMDMSGNNATRENYMDMSGSSPVRNSPRISMSTMDYIRQFGRGTSQENQRNNDYVDMNQTRGRTSSNASSSRVATSPGSWSSDHNADYLDMSGRNRRSDRTGSFSSQMSSSPYFDSVSSHDIDGYVKMTPGAGNIQGNNQHQRQSSLDSNSNVDGGYGDYLNMSGINLNATGLFGGNRKKERSQPISIQTTSNSQGVKNSSPISISSLLGIKFSPTNSASKMHLPLSSHSSLPRQKSPKKSMNTNSSKSNSSTSSSVTTTPSSSSTMFPLSLNSPSSPASSSKAGTPSTSGVKVPVSILNVPYKSSAKKSSNEGDYAMMDFASNKISPSRLVEESPYMNYCPPGANAPKAPITVVSPSEDGDYAIMKPGTFLTKSTTLPRTKGTSVSGAASPLSMHLSTVALNDRPNLGFRPIRENDERVHSPKPGDQVPDRLRQEDNVLEEANMDIEDESRRSMSGSVSPAAKISRPNSSNSEIIKTGTQRPASISGTEKVPRPSSVCSEGLASRLGSNSSVYSSSSSTSTVVGVPTVSDITKTEQQNPVRLHYASLDLTPEPEERKSPRTVKNVASDSSGSQSEATFVYADIDFIKSEELSKNSASGTGNVAGTSTKVKNRN